jgi:hypothetical protein
MRLKQKRTIPIQRWRFWLKQFGGIDRDVVLRS